MLMIMWGLLFYDAIKPLAHIYKKKIKTKKMIVNRKSMYTDVTLPLTLPFLFVFLCVAIRTLSYIFFWQVRIVSSFNCIISLACQ